MVAAELLACPKFGEHFSYVGNRAAHPFQFAPDKAFTGQRGAHLVIGKDRAIFALGGLVQFDTVVLDGSGAKLFAHAALHVARRLANLEKPGVRLVGNRIGVDAWARFRLRCEDFVDRRLIHLRWRPP